MNLDPRTVQMALRVVGAAAIGLARVIEAVSDEITPTRKPRRRPEVRPDPPKVRVPHRK